MMILLFIVLFLYVILISAFVYGFSKTAKKNETTIEPKTSFTIVVPFRNEAENLPKLLHSLSLLNYPESLVEIILVDDESEEVFNFQFSVFKLYVIKNERKTNSPKKDAINTAISIAKMDWIITTDADCLVQKDWLLAIDNYIQERESRMIALPVLLVANGSILQQCQQLDFLSLQGATMGSFGIQKPFMCNGANFAYEKSFFSELNGFEGNDSIASGDDVFLLQKAIQTEKSKVSFCANRRSVVATQSEMSWSAFFFQRVRWASKSAAYQDGFSKAIALVVFLTNLFWIIFFGLWLFGFVSYEKPFLFFGIKFLVDVLLLAKSARFFNTRLQWLFLYSLLYPFFTSAVALYSLFGKYEWKGRRF